MGKDNFTPEDDMINIDILETEMSEGLPHWLDPMYKYSSTHDEDRRKKQKARSNEIMNRNRRR